MHDRMSCPRCRELLPAYLTGAMTGWEMASLRTHLKGCQSCRSQLAGYFPLERWAETESTPSLASANFTSLVMAALDRSGRSPVESAHARPSGGWRTGLSRQILRHYLAAACATLVLVFTNCFGIFVDLAGRADRLNEGARAIYHQTQHIMEIQPEWRAVWSKLRSFGKPVLAPTERSGLDDKK